MSTAPWTLTPWERTGSTWGRDWRRSTGPKSEDGTEAIRITQESVSDKVIELPVPRGDGGGRAFSGLALSRRFSRVVVYAEPPANWWLKRERVGPGWPTILAKPAETCKPPDAGPIANYERPPIERGVMDEQAVAMAAVLEDIKAEADELLQRHLFEGECSPMHPRADMRP